MASNRIPEIAVEFIDCRGSKKCKGFKSEEAMRRWLRRKIEDGTIWEIVGYSDGKRRTIETEYLPI